MFDVFSQLYACKSIKMKAQVVKEIHRQARKKFRRRHTTMRGIKDTIQADLIEMIPYSSSNRGMKYILVIINIFSKMVYARPIKNKSGPIVSQALKSILDEIGHSIKNLHVDNGKEFYNKHVLELMHNRCINMYSTYTTMKAAIVERFNRTLKHMIWTEFSMNGNYKWVNRLQILIDRYNRTKHRTIKMKPIDVNKHNEQLLLDTIYNYKVDIPFKAQNKFKIGDYVRISKYKHLFEKGYTANWTCEIFIIKKIVYTDPITYHIEDLNGEKISGCLYEEELQIVKHPDVYLVEKILRKKNNKVFVKWLGFDNKFNSWVNNDDVL